jgi:regulator of sirC expression with transglutaminase-like and TPR domain
VNPTERFHALVTGPEEAIGLAEAALVVAAHQYVDLDVDEHLGRLDAIAAACAGSDLDAVRHHLYGTLGFAGNRDDYYDPRNSFLNDVLDRRTGIPISLAIVVIEVGGRVGVPLAPVGMPGHFLVGAGADVFVDPFTGHLLDATACVALYDELRPGPPFDPAFLAAIGPRAVLSRVLNNLQGIFFSSDLAAARWVVDLRRSIPGLSVAERRGVAQALASLGRFDAAADELLGLRADLPDVADQLEIEARRLRARTN